MKRKAQGGTNAALLIAIIAGLIIVYIIFLPEAEREALLENKSLDDVSGNGGEDDIEFLLRVFPGKLDEIDEIDDVELSNVFLFETTNAETLDRVSPFAIRNGWFDTQSKAVSFSIDDLNNAENIILSFQTPKHEGVITVWLNDVIIFEGSITTSTPEPIRLKKSSLDSVNTLEFSVSGVGLAFWSTNEYEFSDMRIIGDVVDKSKQTSRSIFTLTGEEVRNIDEADLRFVPFCSAVANVGVLDIDINSRNVFSGVPVCDDPYKQPIPLRSLESGTNTIEFSTTKGSYSIEQIKIEFEERELDSNLYFFEVNDTTIEELEDNDKMVNLFLEFVDDEDTKKIDINVNDHIFTFDDEDRTFERDIEDFIKEGNNFVEVRQRSDIELVELSVRLEDEE